MYTLEIQNHWKLIPLNDLGEGKNAIVDGPFGSNLKISDYIDDRLNGVPVLTTKNLEGDYSDKNVRFISKEKFEGLKRSEVKSGDIIIAKIGSIGKTGVYPKNLRSAIIPANLLKFTVTKKVVFNYVFNYLNFQGFQDNIKKISSATAQPAFNVTKFRKLCIPLPPFIEQRAIVSKIEQLFSDLNNGIENFKKAQEQLKIYRQVVLKNACEGKLVPTEAELARSEGRDYEPADVLLARILEERREKWNGKGKYKEPAAPDTSELSELPEGWGWATFDQVSDRVTVGHVGSMKDEYIENGVPFLRSQNVRENNFDSKGLKFISREFHKKLKKSSLQPGDLVVVRSGDVGVSCVIPENLKEANCSDLIIVKQPYGIFSQYGAFYMNSIAQSRINAKKVGVALIHFNTKSMAEMPISLPPIGEQNRIVSEIETRLSICDKMEETIAESLQKAESLRQSILKKAFEGKLLNEKELEEARNAPDWEPAEKLLERIKAEKTNIITKKKGKK
jgi:type I restriction enzyme, S subunit